MIAIVGFSSIIPLDPALDQTHKFERKFHISIRYPFLTSYLLLTPSQLEPGEKHPLVVALHGGHKRSLAAFAAAQDKFQQHTPAFVLMPMAPFGQLWAVPPELEKRLGKTDALLTAMDVVKDVIDEHAIDHGRVYVTGSSNGAVGTFAAMAQYGDLFAAGVAVNGAWSIKQAELFTTANLAIFHGDQDQVFSPQQMYVLVDAIRAAGGRPKYMEMKGVGHDSWPAYSDPALWEWLFSHSR